MNKTKANVKAKPPTATPGPLRAKHSIARPAQLDKAKVEEVVSLCRQLGIVVGRQLPDAKLLDTLLTPSPQRFVLLCNAFQTFCPELEDELEDLKPPPKVAVEEARFQHVVEFCHDIGLFDDGDEADLAKIKGELPECDHLDFWLGTLRTAKMMSEVNDAPPPGADDVLAMAEGLTRMMQISQELNPAPEPSWLSGALLEKVEETSQSYSSAELRKAVAGLDAQLAQLQNQIAEVDEDDAEESTLSGREDPPEALADDTTVMKIKLLQGNLKDLVNTFSALYDASLKNAVASGCSHDADPHVELEEILRSTSKHQGSLSDFVNDVRRILRRLATLRDAHLGQRPVAEGMSSDYSGCLALNLDTSLNSGHNEFPAVRSVYGDLLANV